MTPCHLIELAMRVQHMVGHASRNIYKYSSIGEHLKEEYSLQPTTKPVYSSKLRNAAQSLTV